MRIFRLFEYIVVEEKNNSKFMIDNFTSTFKINVIYKKN